MPACGPTRASRCCSRYSAASRSLFEAIAGMDLLPLVRELEARLETDEESKDVDP